tara:strand:- start:2423 stop:4177 length:1755 start_codon:yes stop_codon:yes gene_type:complete
MKKNKTLIIYLSVILFAPLSLTQNEEYDESFLESLPEEVREDLLERKKSREDSEEPQYRRPSSFINKPEDIEDSDRFGIKIFSMMQTTLMPLNEPNFDGSYTLDYGDVLEVQLVGQRSSVENLPVKRDGSISLPEIGKIFVSGLPLEEASEIIKSKVNTAFIGVNAYISLVNVRDIQIIVAGNVFNPGPYTLNGNSNLFHALSMSGGPSEIGSFRSIDLIRNGQVIESMDLYETFIYGTSSFGSRLRSGDVVFVRPVSNLVRISGGVRRSGTYELKPTENLDVALQFANGITNKADLSQIKLFRLSGASVAQIAIENIAELSEMNSNDNDKIIIREFPFREVEITGAVENPGKYIVNQGDGILEIVEQAGGYTETAYPFGGVLENLNTEKINEMAISELYTAFLNSISANYSGTQDGTLSGVIDIMKELKETPVSGRVSAEFDLDKLRANSDLDIKLQDGDKITIPEMLDHVYIYGEVSSQGTVKFQQDKGYQHYIDLKGGFAQNADDKAVFILQPNGETIRVNNARNLFMTQGKNQIDIYPGSVIFVPRKAGNALVATQTAQAYAAILGNIGVSLASLSVLKD